MSAFYAICSRCRARRGKTSLKTCRERDSHSSPEWYKESFPIEGSVSHKYKDGHFKVLAYNTEPPGLLLERLDDNSSRVVFTIQNLSKIHLSTSIEPKPFESASTSLVPIDGASSPPRRRARRRPAVDSPSPRSKIQKSSKFQTLVDLQVLLDGASSLAALSQELKET